MSIAAPAPPLQSRVADLEQLVAQLTQELRKRASTGSQDAIVSLLKLEVSNHVKAAEEQARDLAAWKKRAQHVVGEQQRQLAALEDENRMLVEDAALRRAHLVDVMRELEQARAVPATAVAAASSAAVPPTTAAPTFPEPDHVTTSATAASSAENAQREADEAKNREHAATLIAAAAAEAAAAEATAALRRVEADSAALSLEMSSWKDELAAERARAGELATHAEAAGARLAHERALADDAQAALAARIAECEAEMAALRQQLAVAEVARAAAETSAADQVVVLRAAQAAAAEAAAAAAAMVVTTASSDAAVQSDNNELVAVDAATSSIVASLLARCVADVESTSDDFAQLFAIASEDAHVHFDFARSLLQTLTTQHATMRRWQQQVVALSRTDAETIRALKDELARRDRDVRALVEQRREVHALIMQLPQQQLPLQQQQQQQQQHHVSSPQSAHGNAKRNLLDELFQ